MASFNLNTTTTVQQSLTASEDGLLGPNGAIMVLGADAIVFDGTNTLAINGSVMSDQSAIYSAGASLLALTVGSTGNILSSDTDAIDVAISVSTSIVNHGTIAGDFGGLRLGITDTAGSLFLTNSGTITGSSNAVTIEVVGFTSLIVNSGSIVGLVDGIDVPVPGWSTDAVLEVWNTGTISGSLSSFTGANDDGSGTSSDQVYNAGLMQGDIFLNGGDDIYDGRGGTLQGTVFGGAGDDLYILDDPGTAISEDPGEGTDEVQSLADFKLPDNFENLTLLGAEDINGTGNDDANTITGNAGANTLSGGGGADTINAEEGDDVLRGGSGADYLRGKDGDDTLAGNGGIDQMFGGNGADVLSGGEGDDRLFGGNGDDYMRGGLGADRLEGEAGADRFVFTTVADSGLGAAADRIIDFTPGEDRLHLAGIAPDMTLNIGGPFTGAGPSVRTQVVGPNTEVYIDADGDGIEDMQIRLIGATSVSESDFIL